MAMTDVTFKPGDWSDEFRLIYPFGGGKNPPHALPQPRDDSH